MAHVADVAAFVDRAPDRLALLGAPATEAETDYGWIEPGDLLDATGGTAVFEVRRFHEKPTPDVARALLARGWLWNTFVCVARAATLIAAGAKRLPDLHERLSALRAVPADQQERALHDAYAEAPAHSFSRTVLEAYPRLAVSKLPVAWSDVGTPARLLAALGALGIRPSWASRSAPPARRASGGNR
jgi:mannose-1-phosphate guanylyltransferase